jgi:hypothetical protein
MSGHPVGPRGLARAGAAGRRQALHPARAVPGPSPGRRITENAWWDGRAPDYGQPCSRSQSPNSARRSSPARRGNGPGSRCSPRRWRGPPAAGATASAPTPAPTCSARSTSAGLRSRTRSPGRPRPSTGPSASNGCATRSVGLSTGRRGQRGALGSQIGPASSKLPVEAATGEAVDRRTDAEHLGVAGPTVDSSTVVADLYAGPVAVDGRDEVQVRRPGDAAQGAR